jgi:hypothetical protein
MKPSLLKVEIISRFKAKVRRSILLESSPGIGKTQIAGQAAKELAAELGVEIGFKAIHAPTMPPEDYGLPVPNADKTDLNFIVSKHKFPLVGSDCPELGILLIDELPQADNAGQKVLANLVQEREIHGHPLKEGWMIIATGNRTTDRSGANRVLSHLRNRVCTVPVEVSLDDWTQWAIANAIKPEVISFLRFRPQFLNNFDPQQEINATPRSWSEGVSPSLGVTAKECEMEVFTGDVGEQAAAEFLGFLKIYRGLPNIDRILVNPKTESVPKPGKDDNAGQILYALCGALSHRATEDNFGRIMEYVGRMPGEFQSLFVKMTITCRTGKKSACICTACKITHTSDWVSLASGPLAKILT